MANKSLSIANISSLSDKVDFLLQVSRKSKTLDSFIKDIIPSGEKSWLSDLNSWKIGSKWILEVSDICLKNYDQVFFDCGEELLDLNDSDNYQAFREKILEDLM
jgi:hypothetical protein